MFLLDTNVLSELSKLRGRKAHPAVVRWLGEQDEKLLFLSVISLLELEIGVLRKERHDSVQGGKLREWLEKGIIPEFHDRILSVDEAIVRRCATLHVPDPRPERDCLIAATALTHGMTVVTRNIRDFAPTGVKVLNPFEAF